MLETNSHIDAGRGWLGFSRYQWLVIAAGWAGWGFDVFDALLFNFVAANCITTLLRLTPGSAAAHQATALWTGVITSTLLISWAAGGVLFGWVADRIGRRSALMATILLYALGTGLCALVGTLWQLILCRMLAGLGIGGEWGIGAALVAESVPEARRVEAGVIMQTASPLGLMLAGVVNYLIVGVWFVDHPQSAWRYVFLVGFAPVLVALALRLFLRESSQWQQARAHNGAPDPRELFASDLRRATLSGCFVAVVAVLTFWGCTAFLPLLAASLAQSEASRLDLSASAGRALAASWQAYASNLFDIGGLAGALAAIPLARMLPRRAMFIAYFLFSAAALGITFGLPLTPHTRLTLLLGVGAGAFGIFGTLTFYLPELFPARLRATGSGLCYNIGRVFAAAGPYILGVLSAHAGGSSAAFVRILLWWALVPLGAALLARALIVETRGRGLPA
jgi:predicted MFS family arabinose efflux permease